MRVLICRWRGHRGSDCVLLEPSWGPGHRRRANGRRLCRLRQVGRVSCARLVRRDAARAARAPQLRAARAPGGGDRRGLGLSPARYLWRCRRHPGPAGVLTSTWVSDRVAIRQRLGTPETTAQVHPAALHSRTDARGRVARGRAPDRPGRGRAVRSRPAVGGWAPRSTESSSSATRLSSRWGLGRSLPPSGCRSRRSSA